MDPRQAERLTLLRVRPSPLDVRRATCTEKRALARIASIEAQAQIRIEEALTRAQRLAILDSGTSTQENRMKLKQRRASNAESRVKS